MHKNITITLTDISPEFERAITNYNQFGYIYNFFFDKLVVSKILYFSEEQIFDFIEGRPLSKIKTNFYFTNGEDKPVAVWGVGKVGYSISNKNVFRLGLSNYIVGGTRDRYRSGQLFMPKRDDKKAKEMYIDWLEWKKQAALEDAKFFEEHKNIAENTDIIER